MLSMIFPPLCNERVTPTYFQVNAWFQGGAVAKKHHGFSDAGNAPRVFRSFCFVYKLDLKILSHMHHYDFVKYLQLQTLTPVAFSSCYFFRTTNNAFSYFTALLEHDVKIYIQNELKNCGLVVKRRINFWITVANIFAGWFRFLQVPVRSSFPERIFGHSTV